MLERLPGCVCLGPLASMLHAEDLLGLIATSSHLRGVFAQAYSRLAICPCPERSGSLSASSLLSLLRRHPHLETLGLCSGAARFVGEIGETTDALHRLKSLWVSWSFKSATPWEATSGLLDVAARLPNLQAVDLTIDLGCSREHHTALKLASLLRDHLGVVPFRRLHLLDVLWDEALAEAVAEVQQQQPVQELVLGAWGEDEGEEDLLAKVLLAGGGDGLTRVREAQSTSRRGDLAVVSHGPLTDVCGCSWTCSTSWVLQSCT